MKLVAFCAALLLGVALIGSPAHAACKDELASLQKSSMSIKDTKKKAEVEKHWKEGDAASKAGKEADCMKAVAAAKKAAM